MTFSKFQKVKKYLKTPKSQKLKKSKSCIRRPQIKKVKKQSVVRIENYSKWNFQKCYSYNFSILNIAYLFNFFALRPPYVTFDCFDFLDFRCFRYFLLFENLKMSFLIFLNSNYGLFIELFRLKASLYDFLNLLTKNSPRGPGRFLQYD